MRVSLTVGGRRPLTGQTRDLPVAVVPRSTAAGHAGLDHGRFVELRGGGVCRPALVFPARVARGRPDAPLLCLLALELVRSRVCLCVCVCACVCCGVVVCCCVVVMACPVVVFAAFVVVVVFLVGVVVVVVGVAVVVGVYFVGCIEDSDEWVGADKIRSNILTSGKPVRNIAESLFLFSSESGNGNHPDKLCDQVSAAILDQCLKDGQHFKVASETVTKDIMIAVMCDMVTQSKVDYDALVR